MAALSPRGSSWCVRQTLTLFPIGFEFFSVVMFWCLHHAPCMTIVQNLKASTLLSVSELQQQTIIILLLLQL
jgi:hypothetical protein